MRKFVRRESLVIIAIATLFAVCSTPVTAGDDVKVLLEILLEKGVITQQEFDAKLNKVAENDEIKAFNQSQELRKLSKEEAQRTEKEKTIKTEIYGQASAGYYSASNMGVTSPKDAAGMSDQPKGNNRIGLRVTRQMSEEVSAAVTLESNFSTRTGALGKDAGGFGVSSGPIFDREANFRIASKTFGTLVIGRGPNLQTDLSGAFDARQNWNFGGLKPIGRYVGFHSASGINRADKMFRYISPVFNGFNLDGGVSFGGVQDDEEKGSSAYLGGRYKNEGFEAGYNHIEARVGSAPVADVNNRVDFFAAKYTFTQMTVNAGYVITRNPTAANSGAYSTTKADGKSDANTFFTGVVYRLTPAIAANGAWYQVKDKQSATGINDVTMFAGGLTWSPYKEWDFFLDYVAAQRKNGAIAAFTIFDKWVPDTSAAVQSESKKSQSGLSIGAQYKF